MVKGQIILACISLAFCMLAQQAECAPSWQSLVSEAEAYERNNELIKAEEIYRKAVELEALKPKNPNLANAWAVLAQFYARRGNNYDAMDCYKHAIACGTSVAGPKDKKVIGYELELSRLRATTGQDSSIDTKHPTGERDTDFLVSPSVPRRYEGAKPNQTTASAQSQSTDSAAILKSQTTDGRSKRSDWIEPPSELASPRNATSRWQNHSPADSVLWQTYYDKAVALSSQGEVTEAIELFESSLQMLGPVNSITAVEDSRIRQTLLALSKLYNKNKLKDKYQATQALLAGTTTKGPIDPTVASKSKQVQIKDKLEAADLMVKQGKLDDAKMLYVELMDAYPDSEFSSKIVDRLVRIYVQQKKFEIAEILVRNTLSVHETMLENLEKLDPQRVQIAILFQDLALVRTGQCKYVEAEALLEKALKIFNDFSEEGGRRTLSALCDLGFLHASMNEFEKAEKEYALAYGRAMNADLDPDVQYSIALNYSMVLRKLGNVSKAERIDKKFSITPYEKFEPRLCLFP